MSEPKVTYKDVWNCPRCGKIKSPCPRRGCEAIIIGQQKITTEYVEYNQKEFEKANLERGSIHYDPKPDRGFKIQRDGRT